MFAPPSLLRDAGDKCVRGISALLGSFILLIFTTFLQCFTASNLWSVTLTESLLQLIFLSLRVSVVHLPLLLLQFKLWFMSSSSVSTRSQSPTSSPTRLPFGLINDVTSATVSRDADVNVNSLSFNRLIDAMVVMVCDDVGDWCSKHSLVADKLPLIELCDADELSMEMSTCMPGLWKRIGGLDRWKIGKERKSIFIHGARASCCL